MQVKSKNGKLKTLKVFLTQLPFLGSGDVTGLHLCASCSPRFRSGLCLGYGLKAKGTHIVGVMFSACHFICEIWKNHTCLMGWSHWDFNTWLIAMGLRTNAFLLLDREKCGKSCLGWDITSFANIWMSTDISDSHYSFFCVLITNKTVHSSEVYEFGLFKKASRCCLSVTFNLD